MIEGVTIEKTYMVSNIYLKSSELAVSDKEERPLSNTYGVTHTAILTEYLSLDNITYSSVEDLVEFIRHKGKNRFNDPEKTVKIPKKATNDSYRLDKVLYEPLNVAIASSFNVVKALENEIKTIDKTIENNIKGINPTEYESLVSIPSIGPVFISGILAEIGTITSFGSHDTLAKYT